MLEFVSLPRDYSFTKSPIPIMVHTDRDVLEPNLKVVITIICNEERVKLFGEPDTDGIVPFDISETLWNLIEKTGNFQQDAEAIMDVIPDIYPYKIEAREFYGETPVIDESSKIESEDLYGIIGGISFEYYQDINYFDWLVEIEERPFLTWYPKVKKVYRDQPEYLAYFVGPTGINGCYLKVKVYNDVDDTLIEEFNLLEFFNMQANTLWQIPVGPVHLEIQSLVNVYLKLAGRYTVQIFKLESESAISEERTFIIDRLTPADLHYFIFQNSLGGRDVIATRGHTTFSAEVERISSTNVVRGNSYYLFSGKTKIVSQTETYNKKVNTGYLTNAEREWFRDFFLSRKRSELIKNKFLPIIVINKKIEYKTQDELFSYVIEYKYAFDNIVYTPQGGFI